MHTRGRLIAALAVMGMLGVPAVASAHYVTSSSLSCNQLDFSYSSFSAGRETVTLAWYDGTQEFASQTVQTNGPTGNITVSPPDLSPYQGTRSRSRVLGPTTEVDRSRHQQSLTARTRSLLPSPALSRVPPAHRAPPGRRVPRARPGRVPPQT